MTSRCSTEITRWEWALDSSLCFFGRRKCSLMRPTTWSLQMAGSYPLGGRSLHSSGAPISSLRPAISFHWAHRQTSCIDVSHRSRRVLRTSSSRVDTQNVLGCWIWPSFAVVRLPEFASLQALVPVCVELGFPPMIVGLGQGSLLIVVFSPPLPSV